MDAAWLGDQVTMPWRMGSDVEACQRLARLTGM